MSVINDATARAGSPSGADGSATIAALSLTGTYTVRVTKTGFTAEDLSGLTLRAGETATVKVKLVATGGQTEVVVFGTNQGVRADAQIGRRLDSATIDETPILGRKITTLAAVQLRLPSRQGHRRSLRQCHLFRDRLRQPPHDDLHARRR